MACQSPPAIEAEMCLNSVPSSLVPIRGRTYGPWRLDADSLITEPMYGPLFRRLASLCRKWVGDQSEDIAQDALLRASEHLHEFDPERPLWPWLKVIAFRLALDHLRRERRQAEGYERLAELQASPAHIDRGEAWVALAGAISS